MSGDEGDSDVPHLVTADDSVEQEDRSLPALEDQSQPLASFTGSNHHHSPFTVAVPASASPIGVRPASPAAVASGEHASVKQEPIAAASNPLPTLPVIAAPSSLPSSLLGPPLTVESLAAGAVSSLHVPPPPVKRGGGGGNKGAPMTPQKKLEEEAALRSIGFEPVPVTEEDLVGGRNTRQENKDPNLSPEEKTCLLSYLVKVLMLRPDLRKAAEERIKAAPPGAAAGKCEYTSAALVHMLSALYACSCGRVKYGQKQKALNHILSKHMVGGTLKQRRSKGPTPLASAGAASEVPSLPGLPNFTAEQLAAFGQMQAEAARTGRPLEEIFAASAHAVGLDPVVDATMKVEPTTGSEVNPATSPVCSQCHKSGTEELFQCSACLGAVYCSADCQKAAWKTHKRACRRATQVQLPVTPVAAAAAAGGVVAPIAPTATVDDVATASIAPLVAPIANAANPFSVQPVYVKAAPDEPVAPADPASAALASSLSTSELALTQPISQRATSVAPTTRPAVDALQEARIQQLRHLQESQRLQQLQQQAELQTQNQIEELKSELEVWKEEALRSRRLLRKNDKDAKAKEDASTSSLADGSTADPPSPSTATTLASTLQVCLQELASWRTTFGAETPMQAMQFWTRQPTTSAYVLHPHAHPQAQSPFNGMPPMNGQNFYDPTVFSSPFMPNGAVNGIGHSAPHAVLPSIATSPAPSRKRPHAPAAPFAPSAFVFPHVALAVDPAQQQLQAVSDKELDEQIENQLKLEKQMRNGAKAPGMKGDAVQALKVAHDAAIASSLPRALVWPAIRRLLFRNSHGAFSSSMLQQTYRRNWGAGAPDANANGAAEMDTDEGAPMPVAAAYAEAMAHAAAYPNEAVQAAFTAATATAPGASAEGFQPHSGPSSDAGAHDGRSKRQKRTPSKLEEFEA